MLEVYANNQSGSDVSLDHDLEIIRKEVLSKRPVVIRNLLTIDEAKEIREISFDRVLNEPESLPEVNYLSPNYHSIYNNNEKSRVKKILHVFTYFYWNKDSNQVSSYFKRMFKLRNRLSDLPEDYALEEIKDKYVSMPVVQHYPRGGGYMQEHIDPDIKQKVVINVILSQQGTDFEKGGLFYRDENNKKVYVDSSLNPGDAIVIHPQISHGIDPVDPEMEIDWKKNDGRWMCFSTLITITSLKNGVIDNSTSKAVNGY